MTWCKHADSIGSTDGRAYARGAVYPTAADPIINSKRRRGGWGSEKLRRADENMIYGEYLGRMAGHVCYQVDPYGVRKEATVVTPHYACRMGRSHSTLGCTAT